MTLYRKIGGKHRFTIGFLAFADEVGEGVFLKIMEKKPLNNETEIDLIPILKALLSKLWLIVLVGFITAFIAFGSTKLFIKPTYRCSFSAYVNNQHAQTDKITLSNSDIAAAQQLTKTLSYIIRSNTILSASLQSIDSDLSYDAFAKMVSTEIKDETELISVYVVNEDPMEAYNLANAIAKTAPAYMSEIVEGSSMKIVDYPVYSQKRYKPSYVKYALLGFLVGMLAVAAIVVIRCFLDDTVRNEDEIEQRFGLPILGVLPDNASIKKGGSDYYSYEYGYGEKPKIDGKEGSRLEK